MKIAVIIVGQCDFEKNNLDEVIRTYSLNEKNTDIFIYNNNSLEENNKFCKYLKNVKCNKTMNGKISFI